MTTTSDDSSKQVAVDDNELEYNNNNNNNAAKGVNTSSSLRKLSATGASPSSSSTTTTTQTRSNTLRKRSRSLPLASRRRGAAATEESPVGAAESPPQPRRHCHPRLDPIVLLPRQLPPQPPTTMTGHTADGMPRPSPAALPPPVEDLLPRPPPAAVDVVTAAAEVVAAAAEAETAKGQSLLLPRPPAYLVEAVAQVTAEESSKSKKRSKRRNTKTTATSQTSRSSLLPSKKEFARMPHADVLARVAQVAAEVTADFRASLKQAETHVTTTTKTKNRPKFPQGYKTRKQSAQQQQEEEESVGRDEKKRGPADITIITQQPKPKKTKVGGGGEYAKSNANYIKYRPRDRSVIAYLRLKGMHGAVAELTQILDKELQDEVDRAIAEEDAMEERWQAEVPIHNGGGVGGVVGHSANAPLEDCAPDFASDDEARNDTTRDSPHYDSEEPANDEGRNVNFYESNSATDDDGQPQHGEPIISEDDSETNQQQQATAAPEVTTSGQGIFIQVRPAAAPQEAISGSLLF
eukprot:CAMPEP_0168732364 /NCGR_PEP_ID=MMETSP0724-20121128/7734_1 /TAXON_ID=265536 /ORGANISM="Amphiprora sp., Strain CCMP467" /LENGTH=520 /DNA_ID=CAMNT_0008779383 /DNA_START=90 /DNA_END=1652 /DNA_ORIENTATION=-